MPAVELEGVSKRFLIRYDRPRSFQELFLSMIRREARPPAEPFWALRDVTYAIEEGEVLGIIGENGSGKSTLLKLIARILEPSSGHIRVNGSVAALLELGAGFHPDLTGRENIYLNSSILGMSRAETARRFDEIVAFSELERFIDVPVKHYSSGMYVRLGFAVATCMDPQILLIDEILAVGDLAFQAKCMDRIVKLREMGTTIVFVTHDVDAVRTLCTKALWLDDGVMRAHGLTERVIDAYRNKVSDMEEARMMGAQGATESRLAAESASLAGEGPADATDLELNGKKVELKPLNDGGPAERRWGSREVEITGVRFLDRQGQQRHLFETGQPFTVRILYRAHRRIEQPVFGLALHRQDGTPIAGPNTKTSEFEIKAVEGVGYVDYHVESLPLLAGTYDLSISVYDHTLSHAYDHQYRLYPFKVRPGRTRQVLGFLYIPCSWSTGKGLGAPARARVKEEM